MIVCDIESWDKEKRWFPKIIDKAIDYIRMMDPETIPAGTYPIEEHSMYAMVQETTTGANDCLESHASFVDVQYLAKGAEKIGFLRAGEAVDVAKDALDVNDVIFFRHAGPESEIILRPGMFAVFFPNDLHRPCCQVEAGAKIKKVVIKIHTTLFENE